MKHTNLASRRGNWTGWFMFCNIHKKRYKSSCTTSDHSKPFKSKTDEILEMFKRLNLETPFTLSQAFSNIQNLETPFPNLASGGVVSFVFFGATRFGSKGLYPAICNVFLADILSGIITVLRPFIPSPEALTHI
ncbi:hypothetical protein YC2023_114477 [Brassica napus]